MTVMELLKAIASAIFEDVDTDRFNLYWRLSKKECD